MLPCVCSVIDHRWRQNVVKTKKWHTSRRRVCHCCCCFFFHLPQSEIISQTFSKPRAMLNKTKKTSFPGRHPCICTLIDHGQRPITARVAFTSLYRQMYTIQHKNKTTITKIKKKKEREKWALPRFEPSRSCLLELFSTTTLLFTFNAFHRV